MFDKKLDAQRLEPCITKPDRRGSLERPAESSPPASFLFTPSRSRSVPNMPCEVENSEKVDGKGEDEFMMRVEGVPFVGMKRYVAWKRVRSEA